MRVQCFRPGRGMAQSSGDQAAYSLQSRTQLDPMGQ